MPNIEPNVIAASINTLSQKKLIQFFTKGEQLIIRLSIKTESGDDNTETVVLEIISSAGNIGIWVQEITKKSNIPNVLLTKVLKTLENKKRIKSIKSVTASKKKRYMLYDLVPDVSITGGIFYQNQEFDINLVEVLDDQCYKFIEKKHTTAKENNIINPIQAREASTVSSHDVQRHIKDLQILNVEIPLEEIERVLYALVLDRKINKVLKNGVNFYRYKPQIKTAGIVTTPCGLCPVKKDCCETGDISPAKCEYINKWLELY